MAQTGFIPVALKGSETGGEFGDGTELGIGI